MIRLKNVSKYYYSKGVIATGFTRANLEFKLGEFVAITGESGSGKSTLLNVISGLDTYEEGEMYIDGKETSHFLEKDWEDYRRKYIGNIYQNFNLVNSYTVYQNIELVLILNGLTKKEAKPKVLELIKKVNLEPFKRTKVSKLSGGQKQRVAIARALAKDVPIIIADEPTGSLDKKSAESVIKLLSSLAEEKLVIVVTHNYEQVEDYVTRKITMNDGKVLEDKHIKDVKTYKAEGNKYKNITFFNKLKLGFRNTFNIVPKFILLLLVYLFIVTALMAEYASFKEGEYEAGKTGYNYVFEDNRPNRIIVKKNDKTSFTPLEIEKISKLDNIDNIMENDVIVDKYIVMNATDDTYTIDGVPRSYKQFEGKIDKGRLPTAPNEIVIVGAEEDYYLSDRYENIFEKTYHLYNDGINITSINDDLKVVGIKYNTKNSNDYMDHYQYKLYFQDEMLDKLQNQANQSFSTTTVNFMNKNYVSHNYSNDFKIIPSVNVERGKAYISEDYKGYCPKYNCIGKNLLVNIENIYYKDSINLVVSKYYTRKNLGSLVGLKNYEQTAFNDYNGAVFVNIDDFNSLYNKDTYQMSVYVKDDKKIDVTVNELNKMGLTTLAVNDLLVSDEGASLIRIFKIVVTIALIITLFFITYFIIKLILKSRNIYFTTIRMLGAPKRVARHLLIIELFIIANIAYFSFYLLTYLNSIGTISVKILTTINNFLFFNDYLLLYGILMFLSFLISEKYAAKIFKRSVMNSYREEV